MDIDERAMMNSHEVSPANVTLLDRREFIYPTMILYGIFSLAGISANLFVIITIIASRRMRSVTSVFVCHLAVGDLITLVFCMPFTVSSAYFFQNWEFGEVMCYIVRTSGAFGPTLAILALTVMAFERYIGIVHPMQLRNWWSPLRVTLVSIGIYLISFIRAVIRPILGNIYQIKNGTTYCNEAPGSVFAKAYHLTAFIAFYPLTLGFIGYLYIRITQELRKSQFNDMTKDRQSTTEQMCRVAEMRRRVVKMIYVMLAVFSISWLPIHTVAVMVALKTQLNAPWFPAYLFIARILEYGNCAFNPFLYSLLQKKFKLAVLETWGQYCPCFRGLIKDPKSLEIENTTSRYRSSAYKKSVRLGTKK